MKRPRTVLLLGLCLILVLSFILAACGDGEGDDALLGVWTDPTGVIEFEFKSDGTVLIRAMGQEEQATYTAKDGKLSAPDPETGELNEVDYTVDGDTLILGADGEEGTLIRKK
jgi:Family of unknown function (DUF5640)